MRPRPKFIVGEPVRVITEDYNFVCEVVSQKFMSYDSAVSESDSGKPYSGWVYKTDPDPVPEFQKGHGWAERVLHKLPPSERTQWKDTHFQPTDEEVTA